MELLEPRIYVACLASYNNGILHGEWIDVSDDENEIWDGIKAVLDSSSISNAEEYAIHDYEYFEGFDICECEHPSSVIEKATLAIEHGVLASLIQHHIGLEISEIDEYLANNPPIEAESELSFATELFNDIYDGQIPDNIWPYIDYEYFARDLFISDYCSISDNGKIYVIANN
tara:strand:+ start:2055 stop:2573 length:519 start_codon:yes stop_codon:yes gene_type:complete